MLNDAPMFGPFYLNANLFCLRETTGTLQTSVYTRVEKVADLPPSWYYLDDSLMRQLEFKIGVASDNSHVDIILNMIFLAANETIRLNNKFSAFIPILVVKSCPTHISEDITFVITEDVGFQYVTCYREEYITFELYVTPFKEELWVTLGFSLALITAITSAYSYWKDLSFAP